MAPKRRLRSLAQAREEREKQRCDFVSHFTAILDEVTQFETFLEFLQRSDAADGRGELARMAIWIRARLNALLIGGPERWLTRDNDRIGSQFTYPQLSRPPSLKSPSRCHSAVRRRQLRPAASTNDKMPKLVAWRSR